MCPRRGRRPRSLVAAEHAGDNRRGSQRERGGRGSNRHEATKPACRGADAVYSFKRRNRSAGFGREVGDKVRGGSSTCRIAEAENREAAWKY